MRLLTYNIWFDHYRRDFRTLGVCREILNEEADIISLQEVTEESFKILQKYLGKKYYFSKPLLEQSYDVLLLSKYPIIESVLQPFTNKESQSKMARNIHYILVENNNVLYKIITIHLESDYRSRIKYHQLYEIFNNVKDEKNVIIMGDTNLPDEIDLPIYIKDVWIEDGQKEEIKNTFDYTKNDQINGKFKSRLDRIYLSKDLHVNNLKMIGQEKIMNEAYISDHFGLLSNIY